MEILVLLNILLLILLLVREITFHKARRALFEDIQTTLRTATQQAAAEVQRHVDQAVTTLAEHIAAGQRLHGRLIQLTEQASQAYREMLARVRAAVDQAIEAMQQQRPRA